MQRNESPKLSFQAIQQQAGVVLTGTALGLSCRWLTWGLECAMYISSEKNNVTPLTSIYRSLINKTSFMNLQYSFFQTGFMQTIGKATANLGVLHYVDTCYSHLSPVPRGVLAACFSAPFETCVTSRGEWRKVKMFYQLPQHETSWRSLCTPAFGRVMTANLIRNFATSVITFGGMFQVSAWVKPLLPFAEDSPASSAISACLANVVIQPFNMPFINYQTYVLRDSKLSVGKAISAYVHTHSPTDMLKGVTARIIHRGLFYSMTMAASTTIKEFNARDDEVTPKRIKS